ncbi:MAG: organic hydroperoxide resistance protein [Aestuariibacter sp.]
MTALQKVVYTAKTSTTGGREGASQSSDGRLKVTLSTPKEMGGSGGEGTNPEQLFAAGYSACFMGAMKFVAGQAKVSLPEDISIDAEVNFGPTDKGFGIAVKLTVNSAGMDKTTAEEIVEKAHQVCPYSNATRGNIAVELQVS